MSQSSVPANTRRFRRRSKDWVYYVLLANPRRLIHPDGTVRPPAAEDRRMRHRAGPVALGAVIISTVLLVACGHSAKLDPGPPDGNSQSNPNSSSPGAATSSDASASASSVETSSTETTTVPEPLMGNTGNVNLKPVAGDRIFKVEIGASTVELPFTRGLEADGGNADAVASSVLAWISAYESVPDSGMAGQLLNFISVDTGVRTVLVDQRAHIQAMRKGAGGVQVEFAGGNDDSGNSLAMGTSTVAGYGISVAAALGKLYVSYVPEKDPLNYADGRDIFAAGRTDEVTDFEFSFSKERGAANNLQLDYLNFKTQPVQTPSG